MFKVLDCIMYHHDLRLVALAATVCVFACWSALSLCLRAEATRGPMHWVWLAGTGVSFGAGAWATHFIGALAFETSLPLGYLPLPTALSLVIAVAGAILGFGIARQPRPARGAAPVLGMPERAMLDAPGSRPGRAALGGAVIGSATAAMHYVGMAAMRFPGVLTWNRAYVAASLLVAVGAAAGGVGAFRALGGARGRLAGTLLLTGAVLGVHFIGMAAVRLVVLAIPVPGGLLAGPLLAGAIGAVVLAILAVTLASAAFEKEVRRTAAELRRFRRLSEATFEGLLIHRDGVVRDVNRAFCELRGEPAGAVLGQRVEAMLPVLATLGEGWPGTAPEDVMETELLDAAGLARPVEMRLRTIESSARPLGVVAVRDIAERKQAQQRIEFLAHHDALTGLPNRTLFHDRLAQAIAMAERAGQKVALHCIDLDRFKLVNDNFGHPTGDALLTTVAAHLQAEVREMDTIGRLGGDEFAIVQPFVERPQDAASLARRLVERLGLPMELNGSRVLVGASVGVALYPDDGRTPRALMEHADLALFRAKQEGRGTFCFFEPAMDERLRERRVLEQDLRRAIEANEFEIHYQKLCDSGSRSVIGYEALLRWNHPERGLVPPADFIPLAEESGLIVSLGRWVLQTACREAASWAEPHAISINISPVQFAQRDIAAMVGGILRASGLAPGRLEFEITEGVLIGNTERALDVLWGFKSLGVKVKLDDFGTGYSSLGYLRRFPFDGIKIDRSFIQSLGTDQESATIVNSILALCRGLDLHVTAEGVETEAQLETLIRYGCETVQGFLLGRPVPARHLRPAEIARAL